MTLSSTLSAAVALISLTCAVSAGVIEPRAPQLSNYRLPIAPKIQGCVDTWATPFYVNRRYTTSGFPQPDEPVACTGQLVYLQDGNLLASNRQPVSFIYDAEFARFGQWAYTSGGFQLCPSARILVRHEEPVFEQCSFITGANALFDGKPVAATSCHSTYLAVTGFSEECKKQRVRVPTRPKIVGPPPGWAPPIVHRASPPVIQAAAALQPQPQPQQLQPQQQQQQQQVEEAEKELEEIDENEE